MSTPRWPKIMLELSQERQEIRNDIILYALRGNGKDTRSLFLRQLLSGGIATFTDLALFQILLSFSPLSILWASFVSACAGMVTNFLLSKFYVFYDFVLNRIGAQAVRYVAVAMVSICIAQFIVWLLAVVLGVWPFLAKAVAIPIVFLCGFLLNKTFVFTIKTPLS